jgi:hypothetical protein
MNIKIQELGEPEIEFAGGCTGIDPRRDMPIAGPYASNFDVSPKTIPLGLIALPDEVEPIERWIRKMHRLLLNSENNVHRFREFPGMEKAFRARLDIPQRFIRRIDQQQYDLCMSMTGEDRFQVLLELYQNAVKSFFSDIRPACVLVQFPEDLATLRVSNPKLSFDERKALERIQREEESEQLSLFEPTEEEKRLAAELLPQAEELLFRNFHRALKASCMMEHNAIPIQIVRRHTYIAEEAKQSEATRAWNLGLALYYKAGNIPWRPAGLPHGTCFIGVSFHHLKRRSGSLVYASVAQAFSNEVEPFALKGESIPHNQTRHKRPYLTEDQASRLMASIVKGYEQRTGSYPVSVIVHKTSRYEPEEEIGFRQGLLDKVPACHLVWMTPTGFRLLKRGMREPSRSTLCTIEDDEHYLFTTGYVPWWDEYPGPHIPAPLQIGVCGESDLIERAEEILLLTKMNWNSSDGIGRHPISIQFARRVGVVMTEMDEEVTPNPLYRFYM